MQQKKQQFTAEEIIKARWMVAPQQEPLVTAFDREAKRYNAYVIQPDGSISFDREEYDGK